MTCKVCGRPGLRRMHVDWFPVRLRTWSIMTLTEILCWKCRAWVQFVAEGRETTLIPERRA